MSHQEEKYPQGPPSDQEDAEAQVFVKGGFERKKINAEGKVEASSTFDRDDARKDDDEMLFAIEEAEGDEFMATKPWKGAMVEPTEHPPFNSEAPDEDYELEYVYGYRCEDSRQNVRYNPDGKVVYMTAAVGVVLDQETNTQQIFGGKPVKAGMHTGRAFHNDDITTLTVSRDRTLVATGQVGSCPVLIVWNSVDVTPVQRIVLPKGSRAIKSAAFNADASLVACSDEHNDHYVRVYNVKTGKLVYEDQSGSSKLYDMDFHPTEDIIAVVGHKRILFYFGNGKGQYTEKKGILGPAMKEMTAFSSVNYTSAGKALVTNIKGSVLVFKERQCTEFKQGVHKGAIFAAHVDENDVHFTGGKDGFVRASDGREWEMGPTVRSVDYANNKLVVGLRDGTIVEVLEDGTKNELIHSHSEGQVWGLEKIGNDKNILTTGDDNKIILWDYTTRRKVAQGVISEKPGKPRKAAAGASTLSDLPPNQQSRAVAYCPSTGHIAVADNEGGVTIRAGFEKLDEIIKTLGPSAKEWIEAMDYSPNGVYLAVGSHDNFIRVYSVENNYDFHVTLKGHNSFITHLDWSADSKYIRSNCGAYELLFFDADSGEHLPGKQTITVDGASLTADVKWATTSCTITWNTEGVFPPGTDGTHVNTVAISASGQNIASGDDWGLVCIHRNPIRHTKHGLKAYRAHSEHVVRVTFDSNDKYIFSVGGYDQTLMQWRKVE